MNAIGTWVVLLASVSLAVAAPGFDEDGPGVGPRPTEQLIEAACDLDVTLRGAVASVEVRQRIVNPGPGPLAATYEATLPTGGIVTGFSARLDGAPAAIAIPIAPPGGAVEVSMRRVLGPDPALVVARDGGYAVRLQPIAAGHEITMVTRYTALAELRGGAIRLVLPGRSHTGKLTACRGTVRASAGPGTAIRELRIDGQAVGARGTAPLVVDARDVVLEAALSFSRPQPVVWTQTQALADGWSATVVTVAAPQVRAASAGARRVLFVIDGSRSMELVGRHRTVQVVRAIAAALPTGVTIDAIMYDQVATRVHGQFTPATPKAIAAIETAITTRAAGNGTNMVGAFELAGTTIADGAREATLVIAISDGVLGDVSGPELVRALAARTSTTDVLAVVLDPATTRSPGAAMMRAPVSVYGGAFVEISVDDLDAAQPVFDSWLRPSWVDVALGGELDAPFSLHAGSGFTRLAVHRGAPSRYVLTGRGPDAIRIGPRAAPRATVAPLALAAAGRDAHAFTTTPHPDDAELARATRTRDRAHARHRWLSEDVAFAVLTSIGRVARSRAAMVRGGGPYERIVELPDPGEAPLRAPVPVAVAAPSAIAKLTLERLFRDQLQPRAYACYQRALGGAPTLAGTVHFTLHMGRGEITQATIVGLGHAGFDACVTDAAYALALPLPDPTVHADDLTIARYPLTFAVGERRPVIVLGDADSSSPLDIDAIEGGLPGRARRIKVDATTPLGRLRPGK